MARRARSTLRIGWVLAGLFTVLILVGLGSYFLGGTGTPYRSSPAFPVEDYLSTSTSLRGNTYRITGSVLNSIAWSPEKGRLISVLPHGSNSPIPLVVPRDVGELNIQKGQRFHFLIEVREGGVLYATGVTKS
jgi:hypothetical protein